MNSLCPKLYHAYSNSFSSSNVGNFFWSWNLKTVSKFRKRKGKLLSHVFTSSIKSEIRHFHVVVVQRRQGNVQKSMMRGQSCFFTNLNLLLFSRSRCRSRLRCLSSPLLIFTTTATTTTIPLSATPALAAIIILKNPKIGGLRRRRKRCLKSDIEVF